jgi:aspartyl-tRNA(Asn)/glutamyl-tRNA(Gln) amidotransferase subunit C
MSSKSSIDKKTLEYLAELGRIELDKKSEDKLLGDLQKILEHFKELKEVDTENIEPTRPPSPKGEAFSGQVAGGTVGMNVFREDSESSKFKVQSSKLTKAFPEKENGFLKVPPIFQNNE